MSCRENRVRKHHNKEKIKVFKLHATSITYEQNFSFIFTVPASQKRTSAIHLPVIHKQGTIPTSVPVIES